MTGCTDNNLEYHFNGKIGEDAVKFYELDLGATNVLEVVKANGDKVKYLDYRNDFKIDCVALTVGDNTTEYHSTSSNPLAVNIVEKAQKEFDAYLARITAIQTAPLNGSVFNLPPESGQ